MRFAIQRGIASAFVAVISVVLAAPVQAKLRCAQPPERRQSCEVVTQPSPAKMSPPDLPIAFEAQSPGRFVARTSGTTMTVTPHETVVHGGGADCVRFRLVGAGPGAVMNGVDRLPGVANYLVGSDPKKWRTNVPTYGGARCESVYPGIDAIYHGEDDQLVWDFHVAPKSDPRAITIEVDGAREMAIDAGGDLVATTATGEVREKRPVVYQEDPSGRVPVESRFVLRGENRFGFEIGAYDATRPLVIDPTIAFSFSIGGGADTFASGVAIDSGGNSYIVGDTRASDFPVVGGVDGSLGGFKDAFVSKLNADGTALVYSTYLGGSDEDRATGIAVDATGAVYVCGATGRNSTNDFPTTAGAFQTHYGGSGNTGGDAFVAKLAPDGASLVYSTFLGGSEAEGAAGIAIDSSGNACVMGATLSTNFPTANAAQLHTAGKLDAFVAKLNSAGSALVYSTYLGGAGDEATYVDVGDGGIAVDTDGNAYVTGNTSSTNFPVTAGAFQATNHGGTCALEHGACPDAFVTKLTTAGVIAYSTYLGGSADDGGSGIAVDATGAAYVTGSTRSADFPLQNAFQTTHGTGTFCGGGSGVLCPDAFVTKLAPDGASLAYSSFLGGDDGEYATGIALDAAGSAYVTGDSSSTNFPVADPLPEGRGGGDDVYVTRVKPDGSGFDFSSSFGGSSVDRGVAIAVDAAGSAAYVAVTTRSSDFPRSPVAGKIRGSAPNDAGGVKIQFAQRKTADVRILKIIVSVATPMGMSPRGIMSVDIINDGPEDAESVTLNVDTTCALFHAALNESNLMYVDVPGDLDPAHFVMRATKPLRPREEASVAFFYYVDPTGACPSDGVVRLGAVVSSSASDPDLTNNSRTVTAPNVNPDPGSKSIVWGSLSDFNGGPTDPQLIKLLANSGGRPVAFARVSSGASGRRASGKAGAVLTGYRVYASAQPNVQPVPANLVSTVPPTQYVADVSASPDGSYFVVTAVYDDGTESPPSSEVGGPLPTISSVKVSDKKIVATGSGFSVGEKVTIGGVGFAAAAKLKKNNTKLVQKSPTEAGGTIGDLLELFDAGDSLLIVFSDTKGNGVGYVYTK